MDKWELQGRGFQNAQTALKRAWLKNFNVKWGGEGERNHCLCKVSSMYMPRIQLCSEGCICSSVQSPITCWTQQLVRFKEVQKPVWAGCDVAWELATVTMRAGPSEWRGNSLPLSLSCSVFGSLVAQECLTLPENANTVYCVCFPSQLGRRTTKNYF